MKTPQTATKGPLRALITGASGGIGEALAHCFAADGHDLVLVARSADKLKALAAALTAAHGVKVAVIPADLGVAGAAAALASAVKRKKLKVDVLVNNAGILEHGPFTAITAKQPGRHQQLIDLNVTGLTALLEEFVPAMVERGLGRVLNVASIAAFQPIPSLAVYAATKAYVLSLTEALSEELKGSGVTVTALCPGVTATGMLAGATASSPALAKLPDFLVGDVADVARQAYNACLRGDVICVPGAVNLAMTLGGRATPKWLLRKLTGTAVRKLG